MFQVNTLARTVWVGDLQETTRTDENGNSVPTKSITFTVASDRPYIRRNAEIVNGYREKDTDFLVCRAYGARAQLINDYYKIYQANPEDPNKPKLKSRRIMLRGHIETWKSEKGITLTQDVNIPNAGTWNISIPGKIMEDKFAIVVDNIEPADSNPANTAQAAPAQPQAPAQPVATATPATIPQAATTPAPAAAAMPGQVPTQPAPAMNATPQAVTSAPGEVTATDNPF